MIILFWIIIIKTCMLYYICCLYFSRSTVKYFVWCLIMPGWEPILMKYWKAAGRMAWLRGRGSQGHIRYVADSLWAWRKGVGVCVCVCLRACHAAHTNTKHEWWNMHEIDFCAKPKSRHLHSEVGAPRELCPRNLLPTRRNYD